MVRQLSNGPYLITTSPSMTHCHRCGVLIFAATVAGLDRHVDVAPLTQLGELTALLAGRPTYNLTGELLVRRSPERIRFGDHDTVLAEHNCTPTAPEHIDGAHMTAAIFLVQKLLGAEVVADTNPAPPF